MSLLRVVWCLSVLSVSAISAGLAAERKADPARDNPQWLLPMPEIKPDPQIPALKDVVGHAWGQEVSSCAQIERYLQALAKAAPDRVVLLPYGKSYEGRTLWLLIISSPENLRRREEIRAGNLQLADPRRTPPDKAQAIIAKTPALVWLSCCIHGNETSSPEAALVAAYHLVADRRPETQKLLQNVVFLIDPLQNPDGHERFVNVFRETRGVTPDANPLASEHTERWPGGRFNHYLFDLNRDWFLQSQRETQARVASYLQWQPHIHADAHEMGHNATYFFYPPTDPINPYVLPSQTDWLHRLGRHVAGRFDEHGFAYTTREMFDAFYPGYGSQWPLMQGALGVLWEQAGVRGLVIDRDDETPLHLHDAVRHHYLSALATVEFAAQNREKLVQGFYESRASGIRLGSEGPVRHYFLLIDKTPDRATALATVLKNNGVEVRRLTKPLKAACTSARSGESQQRTIPAGSFHIAVAQPTGRLLRALLDRNVDMGKQFVERQLRRNAQRLPDEIYDVTSWSLPLAWDTECLAVGENAEVASQPWDGAAGAGAIVGGKAKVAYVVPGSDNAIRALASWLRAGLRVHVADRAFRLEDAEFPPGTLILRTRENPEDLPARMEEAARTFQLRIHAAQTGFVTEGAHFGGPYVRWVRPPKVALVVDQPASYVVGHTWYLFDQTLGYPVTRVAGRNLSQFHWSKYNVLVLPDGDYSGPGGLGEKETARLKQWIGEGGTLILVKGAAAWGTGKKVGLLASQVRKKPASKEGPTAAKPPAAKPEGEPAGDDAAEPVDPVPGAFLRAGVFPEHWITFGTPEKLDVFFEGNVILSPPPLAKGRSLVTFVRKDAVLSSGFCWPETLPLIAETPYIVYQPLGKGHVVGFTDDPNFRAMFPALKRLFINAVMFSPGH